MDSLMAQSTAYGEPHPCPGPCVPTKLIPAKDQACRDCLALLGFLKVASYDPNPVQAYPNVFKATKKEEQDFKLMEEEDADGRAEAQDKLGDWHEGLVREQEDLYGPAPDSPCSHSSSNLCPKCLDQICWAADDHQAETERQELDFRAEEGAHLSDFNIRNILQLGSSREEKLVALLEIQAIKPSDILLDRVISHLRDSKKDRTSIEAMGNSPP